MAEGHAKPNHDYHLVPLSPWPLVGAISAFVMAVGAITWMKQLSPVGPYVFGAGMLGVLYTMAAWWTDVVKEAQHGDHTRVVQISHRYGMILFIASEVMFFVAWFWAYFDIALYPHAANEYARAQAIGGVWPPKGIEALDPWHFPLFNTLILLTSGTTVTWAHHALLHSDRSAVAKGLILTIVLGVLFTSRADLRIHARAIPVRLGDGLELLHADRLPRLPCLHRDDLPDRLHGARAARPVHAAPASRVRVRSLVLALRRRRLAVPVRLHLRVGLLGHGHRGGEAVRRFRKTRHFREGGLVPPSFVFK